MVLLLFRNHKNMEHKFGEEGRIFKQEHLNSWADLVIENQWHFAQALSCCT